jgi:hypothetical protein
MPQYGGDMSKDGAKQQTIHISINQKYIRAN